MAAADIIKKGSKSQIVSEIQTWLTKLGLNLGPIDGHFGDATEDAVKMFQKQTGLDPDGIVGPETMAKLGEAYSSLGQKMESFKAEAFGKINETESSEVDEFGDRKVAYLREYIKELELEPGSDLDPIIPLAWAIQQHRSAKNASRIPLESFVSRTSLFCAIIWSNEMIRERITEAKLNIEQLITQVGLEDFERKSIGLEPKDIGISEFITDALTSYIKQFPNRTMVDSLALAYGFITQKTGPFPIYFEEAGGSLTIAEEIFERLLEMPRIESRQPPSARVHRDLWTDEDLLGYGPYADAITAFIKHRDTRPPLVISIQGPWGQGKTSLMRMVKKRLEDEHSDTAKDSESAQKSDSTEAYRKQTRLRLMDLWNLMLKGSGEEEENQKKPRLQWPTIWFNAWKYQTSDQVWAGLAHCILTQLTEKLSIPEREKFWLKLQMKRIDYDSLRRDIHRSIFESFLPDVIKIGMFATGMLIFGVVLVAAAWFYPGQEVSKIVVTPAGLTLSLGSVLWGLWKSYAAWTKAKAETLTKSIEGAYRRYVKQPDYSGRMGFLHLVEEDMKKVLELLVDKKKPAVIFIDDLDRCSPTKVGQVMEAVNLFLGGDYPDCIFVLGIDAQVVAASMEVVHEKILTKLQSRKGELGWRFMDKFVQLSFVIPRLNPDQQRDYLKQLLKKEDESEIKLSSLRSEAESIRNEIRDGTIKSDEAAGRAGKITRDLLSVDPKAASNLTKAIISAGANEFHDRDPEMLDELAHYFRYLSDNPRTIKRVVNLYRFQRFVSWARKMSHPESISATPKQIASWAVVFVRWPDFIRQVQTLSRTETSLDDGKKSSDEKQDFISMVVKKARSSKKLEEWQKTLQPEGIVCGDWVNNRDLWSFLQEDVSPDLELIKAAKCGIW